MRLGGLILLFLSLCLGAKEYAVIGNERLPNLTAVQIKAIFLKKLTHVNGIHLVPVNLPSHNHLRKIFEKKLLKMSERRLKSYWIKQHYHGKRPPVVMKSQESAILFIHNVQGGLTYIETAKINKPVKILYTFKEED